jgi:hypothetical protein
MRTTIFTFMLLCVSTIAVHAQEYRPAPSPSQTPVASPKQTPSPAPLPSPPKMGSKEVRGGGADTNKDGYISPAEMKAHRQKMIKDHPSAKKQPGQLRPLVNRVRSIDAAERSEVMFSHE